jgi:hypothetical protein
MSRDDAGHAASTAQLAFAEYPQMSTVERFFESVPAVRVGTNGRANEHWFQPKFQSKPRK